MPFISSYSTSQPLVASSSAAGSEKKAPPVHIPEGPLPKQTILIVDDDSALRSTSALMLECSGFKTLVAGNGLEALHQMERNPQIDAVLLDLLMPVMDGEETFRQLRNFWATVPVILISGFEVGEIIQRLGHPAPDGFVQKPFTFAKLTGALGQVLN